MAKRNMARARLIHGLYSKYERERTLGFAIHKFRYENTTRSASDSDLRLLLGLPENRGKKPRFSDLVYGSTGYWLQKAQGIPFV